MNLCSGPQDLMPTAFLLLHAHLFTPHESIHLGGLCRFSLQGCEVGDGQYLMVIFTCWCNSQFLIQESYWDINTHHLIASCFLEYLHISHISYNYTIWPLCHVFSLIICLICISQVERKLPEDKGAELPHLLCVVQSSHRLMNGHLHLSPVSQWVTWVAGMSPCKRLLASLMRT